MEQIYWGGVAAVAGMYAAFLLVGWLADTFRSVSVAEPITTAALIGMLPWFLAIPCFAYAARLVEQVKSAQCV